MNKFSQGLAHVLLIILIFLGLIAVSWGILDRGGLNNLFVEKIQEKNPYPQNRKFLVEGSELFEVTDSDKNLLFENLDNVQEARIGPDGTTIHFKRSSYQSYHGYCAQLVESVVPVYYPYPYSGIKDPAPRKAPWDFQKIGDAYTIPDCGEFRAGGYLEESDYFAYIELKGKEGYLVIEELDSNKAFWYKLDEKYITGLEAKDGVPGIYEVVPIEDTNTGSKYVYAQAGTYLGGGKLIAAFGRLILVVDTQRGKLIGELPLVGAEYDVALNAFGLITEGQAPSIVVVSGFWEGYISLQTILDVSDGKLKVFGLRDVFKPIFAFGNAQMLEWGKDSVIIRNYKVIDDTPEDFYDNTGNPEGLSGVQERLIKEKGYLDAFCSELFSGCKAVREDSVDSEYRYTREEGLVKIR